MTSYHVGDVSSSSEDDSLSAVVLPPPPLVCIPDGSSSSLREASSSLLVVVPPPPDEEEEEEERAVTSPFESVSTPTTSVVEKLPSGGEEKIGRWTEEEHQVFLQGLELHGKQWKTIASMIGTRTVVQVRTHAQKYFQKLERKNRNQNNANAASSNGKTKAGKRKSLPATTLPARKKAKANKKSAGVSRSTSLSLATLTEVPILSHPLSGSHQSLSSENLSTNSPVGVMDFEPNPVGVFQDEHHLFIDGPHGFVEDPLEWLLDGDVQSQLPESSIEHAPMFPDFASGVTHGGGDDIGTLSLQAQSNAFDASILEPIADPKVTVQSLFLDTMHEVA